MDGVHSEFGGRYVLRVCQRLLAPPNVLLHLVTQCIIYGCRCTGHKGEDSVATALSRSSGSRNDPDKYDSWIAQPLKTVWNVNVAPCTSVSRPKRRPQRTDFVFTGKSLLVKSFSLTITRATVSLTRHPPHTSHLLSHPPTSF